MAGNGFWDSNIKLLAEFAQNNPGVVEYGSKPAAADNQFFIDVIDPSIDLGEDASSVLQESNRIAVEVDTLDIGIENQFARVEILKQQWLQKANDFSVVDFFRGCLNSELNEDISNIVDAGIGLLAIQLAQTEVEVTEPTKDGESKTKLETVSHDNTLYVTPEHFTEILETVDLSSINRHTHVLFEAMITNHHFAIAIARKASDSLELMRHLSGPEKLHWPQRFFPAENEKRGVQAVEDFFNEALVKLLESDLERAEVHIDEIYRTDRLFTSEVIDIFIERYKDSLFQLSSLFFKPNLTDSQRRAILLTPCFQSSTGLNPMMHNWTRNFVRTLDTKILLELMDGSIPCPEYLIDDVAAILYSKSHQLSELPNEVDLLDKFGFNTGVQSFNNQIFHGLAHGLIQVGRLSYQYDQDSGVQFRIGVDPSMPLEEKVYSKGSASNLFELGSLLGRAIGSIENLKELIDVEETSNEVLLQQQAFFNLVVETSIYPSLEELKKQFDNWIHLDDEPPTVNSEFVRAVFKLVLIKRHIQTAADSLENTDIAEIGNTLFGQLAKLPGISPDNVMDINAALRNAESGPRLRSQLENMLGLGI